MRTVVIILAGIAMTGCAGSTLVTDTTGLVNALNNAGCSGSLKITNTVTTASLGAPAFTHTGSFDGNCGKTTPAVAP